MAITALRRIFCIRRRGTSLSGFARDDEGNAALEYALVAPIFFATLLAIFEVGLLFGNSVLLESAANNSARAVRTGQVYLSTVATTTDPVLDPETGEETCSNQQYCDQRSLFEQAMCNELILIACADLSYDVRAFDTFTEANAGPVLGCDTDGKLTETTFDLGQPAQVVVVTIVYPYRPIIPNPLIYAGRDWKSHAEGGCNGLSMRSVLVFRNEPFPLA